MNDNGMGKKISMGGWILDLSQEYSNQTGQPATVVQKVMRECWSMIPEALLNDGQVKVKGLGTFKLVVTKDRESVNVNNGERIVIKGYKKVAFTPDPAFTANADSAFTANADPAFTASADPAFTASADPASQSADAAVEEGGQDELVEDTELRQEDEGLDALSLSAQDKINQMETITVEEQSPTPEEQGDIEEGLKIMTEENQDEFGGIDLLIPTPESIADAEQQYERAKKELEEAMTQLEEKEGQYMKMRRKLMFLRTGQVEHALSQDHGIENDGRRNEQPQDDEEQVDNNDTPISALMTEASGNDNHVVEDTDTNVSTAPTSMPKVDADEEKDHRQDQNDDEVKKVLKQEYEEDRKRKHKTWRSLWIFLSVVCLFLVVWGIFAIVGANRDGEGDNNVVEAEEVVEKQHKAKTNKPELPAAEQAEPESGQDGQNLANGQDGQNLPNGQNGQNSESGQGVEKQNQQKASSESNPSQQKRPATYILQKGQSLTDVSVMFYGTKDSVMAIIRNNNFRNPDNVFVGTEIKLP